ncbi:uncharacterized protein LACBIDRAFT_311006 [Laccaria bicolor S238N-H82]|uniref:Predicted protein n=1 Tax=Laccaria bicolor (strain S238N-H82 / ATCC MYA-4686) TaxID=486041 RepID=B0DVI8_LACBS|nr:uncharacterized protein LACBIDRAFT_311006 [Laccaria bicolor S238N-H82]EDR01424.1 predicted protein [Laccaria bicolor S238N-H82]|eukprot:XP_001887969.1 predicted protein [Laccaria bicolor S238N-H82]
MLGSSKLNGMAGHSAIFSDHFSHTQGAKASRSRGAQALYYPMSPPQNKEYNPSWPASYDLSNLPICTEEDYWETIHKLSSPCKPQQAKITNGMEGKGKGEGRVEWRESGREGEGGESGMEGGERNGRGREW